MIRHKSVLTNSAGTYSSRLQFVWGRVWLPLCAYVSRAGTRLTVADLRMLQHQPDNRGAFRVCCML
jgi:hypothetical protein